MIDSPNLGHRQRQAQMTRTQVATAARALFAERGYARTTIEAISDAAQIPIPTIYSSFRTKPAILEEIRRAWIEASNVEELHAEALALADPWARLRMAALWTRRQFELGHDVIAMEQEAARIDRRVETLWREALARRERAVLDLIDGLAPDLRPSLGVTQAVDRYVAATLPETYQTLTERGWSPDAYEEWLGELLIRELLGP